MTVSKREISKDIYERAMEQGGYISKEDMSKVFCQIELCGYGVYSPKVSEEDGKYFVYYKLGSSCD